MQVGPLYPLLLDNPKRIIVLQGGGDALKTTTVLQVLATKAIREPGSIITVEGEDIPNLKAGALRTFQRWVISDEEIGSYVTDYNKSDRIYTFKGGSIIEFKSYDDEQDARGSERDYLYMVEANSRPYNMFWQLQRKTRKQVFMCYNPTSRFWAHEKLTDPETADRQFKDKVQLYIVDHRHNPFLTDEEHEAYESITDPDMFSVYARGKTGKIKGLIFGHFKKIEQFPEQYDRIIWGIDYGYTNDPTALVKIAVDGRKRYCKECSYQPGLSAQQIKELLLLNGWKDGQPIYSEADPNIINQLRQLALPALPAIKGPGSVAAGISKVKEFECFYTADSINFEKEIATWKWTTAEDVITGKEVMTNIPVDAWNHLCDGARYAIYTDTFRYRTN